MASSEERDKSQKVTEEDLQDLAGELTKEWLNLARKLKTPEGNIEATKRECRDNEQEAIYQMLLSWKRREDEHATYEVLAEALRKANRRDLSNKLRKESKVRRRSEGNEPASDEATGSRSKRQRSESTTVGEEPVKAGLKNIPTPDPSTSKSIPTPTSAQHGYGQFRIQLESLLTGEHVHKLATSFGYATDKIEDISKSETPSRSLVRLMDESGEISPTDISKLITALEKETGLEDVSVKVNETFDLYGEFYETFLHTLESKLIPQDAVSLAEKLGYQDEKIDNIRKSETPSQLIVQFMCERKEISPMDISRLKRALKEVSDELATEVNKAFELQRKTTQFVKELRGKYKNLCGGVLPVPFLREKYNIDKVFVESGIKVQLDKQGNDGGKEKWKEIENHKMIFTDPQVKSKRRIIDGEPGYGKSSLALQITHDWCQKKAPMKDFPILILLRLSQLGNVSDVNAAIKKVLLPKDSKLIVGDIKEILDSSSAVFILDGYDEYPERGNEESDIENIIKGDMFREKEVVLLTRTSCKPHNTPSDDTKTIRLTGFNDALRSEYIRNVVTSHDPEKVEEINQRIKNNPVASDFCKVPLLCVMISHMAKEEQKFKDLDTVTKLFKRVIDCFYRHKQIKCETSTEQLNAKLDRIAFKALSGTSQKITWDKNELRGEIGEGLYDEYEHIGILREEEVFDDDESDYKTETRFFHKLFAEWYAAQYLAKEITQSGTKSESRRNTNEEAQDTSQQQKGVSLLQSLDPRDLHYTYRFACGLSNDAALEIIRHLGMNVKFGEYALLCIAEWMAKWSGSLNTIEDTVIALCSRRLSINGTDSLLLRRCTVKLIEFASKQKIPISYVVLFNCYSTVDLRGGNHLQLKSNLSIPVLTTLNELTMYEDGREIASEEFTGILQYSSKCLALKKLRFIFCLLPPPVQAESVSVLRSRNVKVIWSPRLEVHYQLNLQSCVWEHEFTRQRMTDEDYQKEVKEFREEQERMRDLEVIAWSRTFYT